MSKEWQSDFTKFLEDMGHPPTERHSLDRIDPDGDYCPSNCRWSLPTEQANNKRIVKRIAINGIERTVAQWAVHSGVPYQTLRWRLEHGWSAEEAIAIGVGEFHKKPRS